MNYDHSKRDYLLPEGCKDLTDVWKLDAQKKTAERQTPMPPASLPPPPMGSEVVILEDTTVLQLASLLGLKTFRIIKDLIEMGVYVKPDHELDFDTIAKITRRHGYTAKKAS